MNHRNPRRATPPPRLKPTFPHDQRTWRLLLATMAAAGGVFATAYHVEAHDSERPPPSASRWMT